MDMECTELKKQIRQRALSRRDRLPAQIRTQKSGQIVQRLLQTEYYQNCSALFCYLSFRSEVETAALILQAIKDQKTVACPRVTDPKQKEMEFFEIHDFADCTIGHYGIREPGPHCRHILPESSGALMIVPGSCFHKTKRRIGHGGGYYDRYLAAHPVKSVGLFFDCQEEDMIPCDQYDQSMDIIITESVILF